ncbi:MAG: ABC transporter ATP-binding protein, partial [Gammaproteobacteria bacterium]
MTAIRIDIRSKSYKTDGHAKKAPTIENLDFTVGNGEFCCLVGPSGCGKTTLLNLIAGLDRDFEGTITIDSPAQRPVIGYVFQEPRLLPWRTVRQNIELALPAGCPHEDIEELLTTLGLAQMQRMYPERLSLGMSRRVALARAFVIRPDLLLMDEPFVSLDAPTARKARKLLTEVWHKHPHTVLFVTHDLREAIRLADRLVFLSHPPTRVVGEVPLGIARGDRNREDAIEDIRRTLLTEHR